MRGGSAEEVSPFARESSTKKGVTERFELFAFGSELANGFSELIDSEDQRERLQAQATKKAEGDEEAHVQDDDYIEALGLRLTLCLIKFNQKRALVFLNGKHHMRVDCASGKMDLSNLTRTHLYPSN